MAWAIQLGIRSDATADDTSASTLLRGQGVCALVMFSPGSQAR